ncbi:GNAT family N-acetyltransferase [Streptomyces hoynatensis]|uniref:N-acetyltransferase n=1 Tax=Streptomyces hoynatensis TaxID=1141874 RepID=A0A3A9Z6U8_9ACTN|nr:GNAT family protein [Streptomyces hoynatensis]RKN43789.1 N-acetyltransferase [Streptomyces hoynatensis]
MLWSGRLRGRAGPELPFPGGCGPRRHSLRTERLLLATPHTVLDVVACMAAASDEEAQRWLGWDSGTVPDPDIREALLRLRPGDPVSRRIPGGRRLRKAPYRPGPEPHELLIAVRLDDGRYAGALRVDPATAELGGWLAPHARGRGMGTELFRAGALFGHAHLGLAVVRAGHEPANLASARALAGAGFAPDGGPPRHTLPNGREIGARWLRHASPEPAGRCGGTAAKAPGGGAAHPAPVGPH